MSSIFNPYSWYDRYTTTGTYIESNPIVNGSGAITLPKHDFLDSKTGTTNRKKYEERLALVRKFYDTIQTRRGLITQLRTLSKYSIVQTIKDAYMNEGFYSNNKNEVFTPTYIGSANKSKVNNAITKVIDDLNLQQMVIELVPETMQMGEALWTPVYEDGKGIVEVLDNARIEDILPIYRGTKIKSFYKMTQDPQKPVQEEDKDKYIHFMLPNDPIKIQMEYSGSGVKEIYNLPETLKFGRSIFLQAIDMIKRLEMLDVANLALALRKIIFPLLLSIGVPANTNSKDILELTEYYENHIEGVFSELGNFSSLSVTEILAVASRVRALPQYADGKGSLSVLDLNDQNKAPDTEQTNQIKKEIALYTSTPAYFVSTDLADSAEDRATMLKKYSKFTKRLAELQFTVAKGLQKLLSLHLCSIGLQVKPEEIQIAFKQIIDVDLLQRLEFMVGSSASLSELYNTLSGIAGSEYSGLEINPEVLLNMVNSIFDEVPGAKGILRKKTIPEITEPSLDQNTDLDQTIPDDTQDSFDDTQDQTDQDIEDQPDEVHSDDKDKVDKAMEDLFSEK